MHSTYGKAFSVFGRELDMMTQDSLRFYKSHAVYPNFGGVVLDREEGRKIAECLGDGKAAILQNHGLITVSCASTTGIHARVCSAIG
jgi:ribulose-5-phosphate 4-epimerase/fuculose-1-phosphate aldolase